MPKQYPYCSSFVANSQRECVTLFLNNEIINEVLVKEGFAEVVKRNQNKDNPDVIKLIELEEIAKASKKGKWSGTSVKRTVVQDVENGAQLLNKTYNGVVEHVRDGSTLRIGLILPSPDPSLITYQMITLMLSGVRCPQTSEPYGEEARYFTESRLLHRDVKVRLEQFSQNSSFYGTVTFIERDIAEYLIREGYAKCLDRTLALTQDPKKLRNLEREAKVKKLRLWRDFKESASRSSAMFDAKVVEIVSADALMVQLCDTKEVKKIFFASIRAPRLDSRANLNENSDTPVMVTGAPGDKKTFRPLYDIPFMFEAREFLRKRLIGKTIKVKVDYLQPKTDNFPEKTCCTVTQDGQNIAEQLIVRGLATVVKHRQDDDQRASDYEAFLAAEHKAQKSGKGLYSTKSDAGLVRIADLSTDLNKSKSFAPFLTRTTGVRRESVVEFVFPSSTKLKVYIPKENCLINLILSGVNTPKFNDPILSEAVSSVRLKVLQRDVHIEIESIDKVGNYIGSVYYDKTNSLALDMVRCGFVSVREYNKNVELINAQNDAKKARKGIWKDYKEVQSPENGSNLDTNDTEADDAADVVKIDDLSKRKKVLISNCTVEFNSFHAQEVSDGPKIEELLTRLREEAAANPPTIGTYKPKKGDLVMARFSQDKQWYRAKVDKIINSNQAQVIYIDYGNQEILDNKEIATLPLGNFSTVAPFAKHYGFAFVFPDSDADFVAEALITFLNNTVEPVLLKVEYKDPNTGLDCATLIDENSKKDVVLQMVSDGWLFVDTKTKRDRRLIGKLNEYKAAQESAKNNGVSYHSYV